MRLLDVDVESQAFLGVHGDTLRTADVGKNIKSGTEPPQTIVERPRSREGSQLSQFQVQLSDADLALGRAACGFLLFIL